MTYLPWIVDWSTIALCTIILLYICCQMLVGVIIGVMLPEIWMLFLYNFFRISLAI